MLGRMDTVINRLMDGLYRRQIHNCVNVIVLADHGEYRYIAVLMSLY
jgi:predicted AlkP superfamily pyrophosphatase or phosphodiesterase